MKIKNFILLASIALTLGSVAACAPKDPSSSETSLPPSTQTTSSASSSIESSSTSESKYELKTIKELLDIGEALANDEETEAKYYAKGTIKEIKDVSRNAVIFKDASGEIYCYRINGKTTIEPALKVGEELTLYGSIKKYKNNPQFNYPDIIERNVVVEPPLQEDECEALSILDARTKAPGAKVKISGVVAIKTKTQQFKDNGFYVIDDTSSIYVHSSTIVKDVEVGNKITILGLRDNYLGSSESNAHKQGYLGAIQLVKPVLVSNDHNVDNHFPTNWIKDLTIKEMIETPLSNNITTKVYKSKAFVKVSEVNGNTIIILNDIDNHTGAIVYSCNKAGDFKWLMPYDGKLVELYVSAHNVNTTDSSYNYRLEPIEVINVLDNYKLSDEEKAEYVATYHVLNQFRFSYTSDPALSLIDTFSEELWDIKNALITYASSDENILKIDNNVLHCLNKGKANITVNVEVNAAKVQKTMQISYEPMDVSDCLNVKQAIDAKLNTIVTVKGIVTSKIANKDGVYISDETGAIAVSLRSKEDLKDLHIGDELIIQGQREFKQKDPANVKGQSHIYDSIVLSNTYGKNIISTSHYVDSTLATLRGFTEDSDHTTTVYRIKAKIKREKGKYSTNTYLVDDANELLLYSGNAGDYMWLEEYANKGEVIANVMLCDWNQKGYKGALLSIEVNNKTIYNDNNLAK